MQKNKKLQDAAQQRPAVFLDRDGTIIEDVGMLGDPADIEWFSDAVDSLRLLQERYRLFVITNQSGIAKGLLTSEQVERVNDHLDEMLRREGVEILEWYVCPHCREDGCECIKPKPYFMLEAQRDYNLDLACSFVMGDHPHDVLTGNDHGVRGLYLLTGHGKGHLSELDEDQLVFSCISDAAQWVVANNADRENQVFGDSVSR